MRGGHQDHYTVLGVSRDASSAAIKRAYHAAARRFHPDRNLMPGETELFLDVQQAYEILSDPARRAHYDATLPIPQPTPLAVSVEYSRSKVARVAESQLMYALMEASLRETEGLADVPLGLCLAIDRSTSMQGEKLEVAKAAAIRIMEMLAPKDAFGVVTFGDRANVLVPFGIRRDVKQAQSRIQAIQSGGGTEILRGLEAAMMELRQGSAADRADHLVLLTDGHTYGDEAACLELADEAARLNISIHGLGVGSEWNDVFLDAIAGRTGGNSTYILRPREIESALIEKLGGITQNTINDVLLQAYPQEGIRLTYAFRLQPEGGPIEIGEELHLGPIRPEVPLRVLFEFTIDALASGTEDVMLLEGTLQAILRRRRGSPASMELRLRRPATSSPQVETPPQSMMDALSKFALYRLQERARNEAQSGEYEAATRHLRNLARRLDAQGLHELAETAMLEADNLGMGRSISPEGGKDIKYGTRALLLPPAELGS